MTRPLNDAGLDRNKPTIAAQKADQTSQLGRPAVLVSVMTFLSRIFGFIRDVMVAQLFGATFAVDAFWVAFKIPNFLRRLFAEGAFAQAFVPVLSEYRQTREHQQVRELINSIAGFLAVVTALVTALVLLLAPVVVLLFAPGFWGSPERFDLTVMMLRLTFPYLFFISLTALAGSILNCYGRFALPAFTPVILNVSMIACALLLQDYFSQPVMALAVGVFVGGVLQLALQLPLLKRLGFLAWPRLNRQHPGVRKVFTLMLPAIFGVSVTQIGLLLGTLFASFLPVGSVSWLYYSDRLTAFPLGIFGIAIATVILPLLSRRHVAGSHDAFTHTLQWATRVVLAIALPAGVGLMVLAGPILATLFGYGEFSSRDVLMTRLSLMALALGVPAFMLVKVYATGFYAQQDIRTPVRYAVVAMGANVVLNAVLMFPFAHMGLALATSLASGLNALLLVIGLVRRQVFTIDRATRVFIAQSIVATAVMSIGVGWFMGATDQWLGWPMSQRVSHLSALLISAMMAYFVTLILLGVRWRHIRPPA